MSLLIQTPVRHVLACLTLLLCLGTGGFLVAAQNYEVVSKRPLVTRIFDPEKNETTTSALLIDPQSDEFRGRLVPSSTHPPPDVSLHSVAYTYPTRTPSRPQAVAFVFMPLDKYKTAPSFSLTADGAVLQEGETTLRELCCVEVNGHNANPQHVSATVPLEIVERLVQARKVELRLNTKRGKYTFKLNDYQKKSLAALLDTMK
ncbi:MAG: hypothetical protein JOZ96_17425 [Acidobacteria bacterium]|nr:hypothetical protein [Acidobacteriota bacterium]